MGDFYSPVTGFHYSSKEQKEAMEKKYMSDLENKKLKEIQKANQIQQQNVILQQQEQQRQRQELIESQRQAILEAEEYRQEEENKRQIIQNVYNEMQRKKELCDKEGVVYNDIIDFSNNIVKPDKKLQEEIEQETKKYRDSLNMVKDKEMFKEVLDIVEKEKQRLGPVPSKKLYKGCSIFFAVFCILMSIVLLPTFFDNSILMGLGWILGMVIAIIAIHFFMMFLYKSRINVYTPEMKKIEMQEEGAKINLKEIEQIENNKELELLEEKIKQLEDKKKRQIQEKKEKFNQFRKEHYNDTMEKLFRNLELDTIDVIREKDSNGKGTKEDYIKYIEQNL